MKGAASWALGSFVHSFTHSCIHMPVEHYCVPDPVLPAGDRAVTKIHKTPCPAACMGVEETDRKCSVPEEKELAEGTRRDGVRAVQVRCSGKASWSRWPFSRDVCEVREQTREDLRTDQVPVAAVGMSPVSPRKSRTGDRSQGEEVTVAGERSGARPRGHSGLLRVRTAAGGL